MKKIKTRKIKKQTKKVSTTPACIDYGPGLRSDLASDAQLVRERLKPHLLAAIDMGLVILHSRFSHATCPMTNAALSGEGVGRPKRWLRSRAPEISSAGGLMSAGTVSLRLRCKGIFLNAGLDVDYDLLTVCSRSDVGAIKAVIARMGRGASARAWPHVDPEFTLLRTANEVGQALRELWPSEPDIEVGEEVGERLSRRQAEALFAPALHQATTAITKLGCRNLSSFASLARNGDQIVRLASPGMRKTANRRVSTPPRDLPARRRPLSSSPRSSG